MTDATTRALRAAIEDDDFVSAMQRCASAFPGYRERLPAIPFAYSRTRLVATPRFEIVAMAWSPSSVTPIHDHGQSRCWVLMLEGALDIENFERDDEPANCDPVALRETGRFELRAGDVDHRYGPLELHRVQNRAAVPAFSLQLYVDPIVEFTVIDSNTRTARIVTAVCDLELSL